MKLGILLFALLISVTSCSRTFIGTATNGDPDVTVTLKPGALKQCKHDKAYLEKINQLVLQMNKAQADFEKQQVEISIHVTVYNR